MPLDFNKPYTFDRVVRIIITFLIFVGLFWTVNQLQDVLTPFIIALLIAYLLNPLVHFFENKLRIKNRVVAVLATLFSVTLFFILLAILLVPMISTEMGKMANLLGQYAEKSEMLKYVPENIEEQLIAFAESEDVKAFLNQENITSVAKQVIPGFWNLFSGSLSFLLGLIGLFIILMYLIFILIDYDEFAGKWASLIPPRYRDKVVKVVADMERGMNNYFRAQALIATIVGVLFAIGFSIIGLPLAIVFGLFVGLLNMIPYLQNAALIPAAFLAILQSLENGQNILVALGLVLVVFIVVQAIQEVFLSPKIMGDATGLNPAIMILALSIWGSLLGVLGMMIALPVSTLMVSYYTRFIADLDEKHESEEVD